MIETTVNTLSRCIDDFLRNPAHASSRDIRLGRGIYTTSGAWGFTGYTMLMGRIFGHGLDTYLRFCMPTNSVPGDDGITREATYYEMLTGGNQAACFRGIEIRGMFVDASASKPVKVIHTWGADCTVADLHITGIWGDANIQEGEGFGIIVNNGGDPLDPQGGNIIENCTVDARRGSYFCGIYLGVVSERPMKTNYVRRCTVRAVDGQGVRRTGVGFGVNSDTVIEDCQTIDVSRPIFSDTDGGRDTVIRRLRANGCGTAIEFQARTEDDSRRRILVDDCDFVHGDTGAGFVAGLVLDKLPPPKNAVMPGVPVMNDIVVRNCRFFNESSLPGHIGSSKYAPNGRQPRFQGCTFVGDWNGDQARDAKWVFENCTFIK